MAEETKTNMWDGRFESGMAQSMVDLSFSLQFDKELLEEDIQGSMAHGKGLVEAGILTEGEYQQINNGLVSILIDYEKGEPIWNEADEDIHMAVERVLTKRIGPLGKKIHTGRSRNDQVATDFKLYMRHRAAEILDLETELARALLSIAKENLGAVMPGYTHLQQAQPIYFSHYVMGFFFAVTRDMKRLRNFLDLHSELPLGSGAIAGSAFPYNRELVAKELGFKAPSPNSIDAVSHRDMALEFLSDLAITASTLSRYAEDFVIWSSCEFGYLTLHDSFSSGSSMMPQKKNPDSMELIRGKAGRMLGNFTALYTTVKGAPLSYSRDLQEDKEPVFDSVKSLKTMLTVMREALETAKFNFGTMRSQMRPALLATDLADVLVQGGMPFRDAHHVVGALVGEAAKKGVEFTELPIEAWLEAGIENAAQIREELTFEYSISRRDIEGGTGPFALSQQFDKAEAILAEFSGKATAE